MTSPTTVPFVGARALRPQPAPDVVIASADSAFTGSMSRLMQEAGYACRTSPTFEGALEAIRRLPPSFAVVEGCFGPWRAANACLELSKHSGCPLIAIDYGADVLDRILALELGADDYLSHPINDREMLARIKALLRRCRSPEIGSAVVTGRRETWRLDNVTRRLRGPEGLEVLLAPSEHQLLARLLKQAGIPISMNELRNSALGQIKATQLRVSIKRLRQKLCNAGFDRDTIRNVRFFGYVFDADVASWRASLADIPGSPLDGEAALFGLPVNSRRANAPPMELSSPNGRKYIHSPRAIRRGRALATDARAVPDRSSDDAKAV